MAFQLLPMNSRDNQTFQAVLSINGINKTLQFFVRWNEIAEYWTMRITDPATSEVLIDSMPLVTGDYPAANILGQYTYLGIGKAYLINIGNVSANPSHTDLGTNFLLVWDDNG
jgi:hypothetical protein